ncbi:LOW QUALITY PROTEIN: peptidyl-prolyl cis-trans isomerase FKBP13, chloroplastic-like [Dendrobium catenatum]|uniref:LOW QUALITY PROTEIN: peptidyl-prolyl cis-trans isomerase FKBP13, chloroplastic-like n=1 Tax=Dendrobium catenatum TaxID=906689 RepID=UPI0009F43248|nr:LOW QUALITY PROTEIN: peptidyl-prolyl cis-trans isomerase FKBP13, chloroplastic-like [Dendrobium catenatum]
MHKLHIAGEMSSTTASSAAAAASAALFRLKPRREDLHNNLHFRVINPNTTSNPGAKPRPQKTIITVSSQILRRRETAFSIAGLCLASVFDPSSLILPSSAIAAERPAEPDCLLTVAPSGLAFCDRVVGSGVGPSKGLLIKAHYVGRLENGKVFDSSYDRGKPITFRVGVGEVIKGWDQGILGGEGIPPMLAGGKRTLKLPPELGYGIRGAGCKGGTCIIPPDSTLLFDVEFIGKA